MKFEGLCYPTGIGSVPLTDPEKGVNFIRKYFPDIPFWPQLPKITMMENMYIQYTENIPGVIIEGESFYVDLAKLMEGAEKFYEKYLEGNIDLFPMTEKYSKGYQLFKSKLPFTPAPYALKGHITGPVSFCMQVVDKSKRALLYDDTAKDILIKSLQRNAQLQEKKLKEFSDKVIIFLDEPYLTMYGSAFSNLTKDDVGEMLEEIFGALSCTTAVHCCGNTDWSVLLDTSVDILSFDTFAFANTLPLYPDNVKAFFERGGNIAWGMVPTDSELIRSSSVNFMKEKMENAFDSLEKLGISRETLARQCLITPTCGVGSSLEEDAILVFKKTQQLSQMMRKDYF